VTMNSGNAEISKRWCHEFQTTHSFLGISTAEEIIVMKQNETFLQDDTSVQWKETWTLIYEHPPI
jgi:hypothetical protein